MQNPFDRKKPLIESVAAFALPVLIDEKGGSCEVALSDLTAVEAKYGGPIGIQIESVAGSKTHFRLTIVRRDPTVGPGQPVS